MSIQSQLSADGSVCSISITGQFDVSQSTRFEDILQEIPRPIDVIRINLKDMLSSDASFMSSILLLREKFPSVTVELFNCSKTLARRFSLSGIDRLVRVRLAPEGHKEDLKDKDMDNFDEGNL